MSNFQSSNNLVTMLDLVSETHLSSIMMLQWPKESLMRQVNLTDHLAVSYFTKLWISILLFSTISGACLLPKRELSLFRKPVDPFISRQLWKNQGSIWVGSPIIFKTNFPRLVTVIKQILSFSIPGFEKSRTASFSSNGPRSQIVGKLLSNSLATTTLVREMRRTQCSSKWLKIIGLISWLREKSNCEISMGCFQGC